MIVINNETLELINDNINGCNVAAVTGKIITDYIKSKNPHENITLALRSIKEDLKEILSHYPEIAYFGQIHFDLLSEVIEKLGWKICKFSYGVVDITMKVTIPNKNFGYYIISSGVEPFTEIRKFKNGEEESDNC